MANSKKTAALLGALAALVTMFVARPAAAAETCGNGIDDDADGYADEGCGFANSVMGVCESPMSCRETGDLDPVTGAWVYQLPPDIAPKVPFGPRFEFKRTYMSMYAPPATNYRTAMGNRWQHNFQSWLDLSGTSPNRVAIVHMPTGQDVKFRESSTSGGYTYYNTFQPGAHFTWLRQATTSPNNWDLRTLTGETYVFDWASPVGKLIEMRDTLATPNKITIAYFTSGGNKGQINTVTDASGHKRFSFSYSQGRVSSVAYQTGSGSTWTTRVTLSLSYTSSNPTTVQIGGSTIQTNTYNAGGYLTAIADGGGKTIVSTNYVSATPGKVANLKTPTGGLGYDYASSNAQCTGQTALFFNLATNPSTGADISCSIDTDCTAIVSGTRCGGKAGTGTTGKCYRAARCLTTTSPSENLITTVTAFTPCTGACAPTAQYSWNTTTLDLKGVKAADNNWTSFQRDGNGMVTLMSQGDSDDDPSNIGPAAEAKTWFFYGDTDFPGRITEARRRTDTTNDNSCDGGSLTTDCKRTLYSWQDPLNATDGLLQQKQEIGITDGGLTHYTYTTVYSYDTSGRLYQIDGPLTGSDDVTQMTFWSTPSDPLKDGYTNLVKRKKDTSLTPFLITTLDSYDYFGNAGSTQDPDSTFTCRTWDANRNYLSQTRVTMNNNPSCVTPDPLDLTTTYVRDTALRLTKITNPGGDCELREYDSFGRLQYVKVRDDCIGTNAGNTRTEYYSANGTNDTTEWADSTGSVKRKQKRSFTDGLQIAGYENPVSPSYSRTFSYFVDGEQELTVFENNIGKTQLERDTKNRTTKTKRFTDSVNSLDWVFNYPAANGTATRTRQEVSDPATKNVFTYVDDMGRRTSLVSPDSGTTSYSYDAASRLVSKSDAIGSSDSFTYDNVNRQLTADYGTETACPSNPVDVTYLYDAGPASTSCQGVTLTQSGCPNVAGVACTRLAGRLAHVKSVLLCASGGSAVYQETFYGYDDNGRLTSEFICDTTGRTAKQSYSWDKNGNVTDIKAPSGYSQTNTYGGTGNSDANLVTTVARSFSGTSTNLLTNVTWAPFGPVSAYDMANTIGGLAMKATFTWNLAYRSSQIKYATTSVNKTTIDFTEDEKGRYTQKLYSNVNANVHSDYLTYDWLDRPTCDSPSSGTCPTSGTTPYTNISRYDSSNNRSNFNHWSNGFTDLGYTTAYNTGADTIFGITPTGAAQIAYTWNARGDRWYEDDPNSTVDKREYTYDGRSHVRTVTGKRFVGAGGNLRDYKITYAFDHRDRLVFRSFVDVTLSVEEQTFYYYDLNDRLIELKDVPNIADTTTYSVYNFYWLGERPVAEWVTAFPSATTARYFLHTADANRVLEVYDWPSSGDATLVWAINPDIFGWDNIAMSGIFQPFRLNNLLADDGTFAPKLFSNFVTTFDRPGLLVGRGVHYDPMTESTLQRRGEWPDEPYTVRDHHLRTSWVIPCASGEPSPTGCGGCSSCSSCGDRYRPIGAITGVHDMALGDGSSGSPGFVYLFRRPGMYSLGGVVGGIGYWDACDRCFRHCDADYLADELSCGDDIWCWERALANYAVCYANCSNEDCTWDTGGIF